MLAKSASAFVFLARCALLRKWGVGDVKAVSASSLPLPSVFLGARRQLVPFRLHDDGSDLID